MLPQVDWAVNVAGIPVIIMNPNQSSPAAKTAAQKPQMMHDHANAVWTKYILPSGFTNLLVIAHSAGGHCLASVFKNNKKTFFTQTAKIAYTDSYPIALKDLTLAEKKQMKKKAVNYKSSNFDLGVAIKDTGKVPSSCPLVSAGHPKHAFSTGCSWPIVAEWFGDDL